MADIEPVVIPVRAEVEPSAGQAIGDEIRRARQDGRQGTGVPEDPRDSVVSAAREVELYVDSLRAVNIELDRFVEHLREANELGLVPGASTTAPLAVPGPQRPDSSAPGGGGDGDDPDAPRTRLPPGAGQFQHSLHGLLGVVGIGLGLGAAYGEASRMLSESAQLQRLGVLTGEARGEGAHGIEHLLHGVERRRFRAFTTPEDAMRILQSQALAGDVGMDDAQAQRLAELGLRGLGSPAAGGQFAAGIFGAGRTARTDDLLASILEQAKLQNVSGAELAHQVGGLFQLQAARQGQRRMSTDDVQSILHLSARMSSLANDQGLGQAGVRIAEGLGTTDVGQMFAMQEFVRAGGNPRTLRGYNEWQRIKADPKRRAPLVLDALERIEDPDLQEFYATLVGGFTPEGAHDEYGRTSHADRRGRRATMPLLDAEDVVGRRTDALGDLPAALDMEAEAARQRAEGQRTPLNTARRWVNQLFGASPTGAAVGEAVGGFLGREWLMHGATFGGGGLAAWLLGRRGAGRNPASVRSGLGASSRLLRGAGGLGGAFALGTDLYNLTDGIDLDDLLAMGAGGLGAGAGFFLGGGIPGALMGYGAGSTLAKYLTGDPEEAEAAMRELPKHGDGWRQPQVVEHLMLMRALVQQMRSSGVPNAVTGRGGEPGDWLTETARGQVRTDFAATWEYNEPTGNTRLRPSDARIMAAAARHNVPHSILLSMIEQESGFDQGARGSVGEIGLMQLRPSTARGLGVNPYTVEGNLDGGAKYLRQLMDRYDGDLEKALVAYNSGMGNVDRDPAGWVRRSRYDDKVLDRAASPDWRAGIQEDFRRLDEERRGTVSRRSPAEEREAIVHDVLGPTDRSGAGGEPLVLELRPGPGFEDLFAPMRAVVPGPRRRGAS